MPMARRIPRLRRESTMTLEETGLARIVFLPELTKFHGVLVNKCDEVFSVRGTKTDSANRSGELTNHSPKESDALYDVKVVDLSNDYEYQIKNVRLIVGEEGEHQLLSQSLTFKTEDLLVGARADREIRQHLSHDLLIGTNQSVHVGPMWIDVTVTVALPSKESITEEVKVADFLQ